VAKHSSELKIVQKATDSPIKKDHFKD